MVHNVGHDHPSDHASAKTRTDYQRIAEARSLAGDAVSWGWSGSVKSWSNTKTLRSREIAEGCGIFPKVHAHHRDTRMNNEEPVTSHAALRHASMAMSAQGGFTPRKREVNDHIQTRRFEATTMVQHDTAGSRADCKAVRHFPVAGRTSASLGYTKLLSFQRPVDSSQNRPDWMRQEQERPGGWNYRTPAGTGSFGASAHFTSSFNPRPVMAG
eukprot:TRINITY_DN77822_c0_g1_i1.p1 TRINITY_DN77822_c0_g1~~TRINITY_DN77822_c0_g1_i1.p1  ORF type:complete len:213 (-),score=19.91 TRINITY_DN77822_c0_g1_i1:74-712(-)